MAPLTRCRALNSIPQPAAAKYYGQRATKGGLIISEATVICPQGYGFPHTPGIHTKEQVKAWKPIVEAVHDKGGLFVCQLWHVGRVSHPDFQPNGEAPVSASAIAIDGKLMTPDGSKPYTVPRALEEAELPGLIEDYRKAARNALDAGFDAVEAHFANGYLVEQFFKCSTNKRTDRYGGPIDNRCRLGIEIMDALIAEVGKDKVGVRLSPFGGASQAYDSHPYATYCFFIEEMNKRSIAYIHMIEPRAKGKEGAASPVAEFSNEHHDETLEVFRKAWHGVFFVAGGYNTELGVRAVAASHADAVAFGRRFLATPDMVKRVQLGAPLNQYHRATFYTQDQVVGYLDYPTLEDNGNNLVGAERQGSKHCMDCSGGAGHADDDSSSCARRREMAAQRAIKS
ncbi:hypothetical protein WJX81_002650 [Elliptochloris bilobata]|uniref:NADH:flavin oxidoreductase/NADH oxidase N-terminal domain-containing protein n=1 Tax=Elliptochloris bilobata TaxID=381761 RepID=A0AAW1SFN9_9CHLO